MATSNTNQTVFTPSKMELLLAKAKAAQAAKLATAPAATQQSPAKSVESKPDNKATSTHTIHFAPKPASNTLLAAQLAFAGVTSAPATSNPLTFNERQLEGIERGLRGQSFVLIGAAGTGKTTTTQELIARIQQAPHMRPLDENTKHLSKGAPGIVICGYTNKAVNNIRKKLPKHLQDHCITIHKLIEFGPVYYEVPTEDGGMRTTMRFEPSRNWANPLPHISTIIFEESSMIGTDLYGQVLAALPNPAATQFIFLGDICQLPPVFGPSILGFKLSELPVIELDRVYRQALASPIISLATAIRTNTTAQFALDHGIPTTAGKSPAMLLAAPFHIHTMDSGEHGKATIHPWKKRIGKPYAIKQLVIFFTKRIASGLYEPEQDVILIPHNKSVGTIEVNKGIADFITKQKGELTHEVIARYTKSYWAVGDRVLVDRLEGYITDIEPTIGYSGKPTRDASLTLDRSGHDSAIDGPQDLADSLTVDDILNEIDRIAETGEDEDSINTASHTIKVFLPDIGEERTLKTAGEINNMLLAYAITVHKSQGSEWRRVYFVLHNSHASMVSRELVYTALTRAREELYVLTEADAGGYTNQLEIAAGRGIVPGVTLTEKIEYFKNAASSLKTSY